MVLYSIIIIKAVIFKYPIPDMLSALHMLDYLILHKKLPYSPFANEKPWCS